MDSNNRRPSHEESGLDKLDIVHVELEAREKEEAALESLQTPEQKALLKRAMYVTNDRPSFLHG